MEIHSCPTLHWAAIKGHHECIQMLVAAGADLNVVGTSEMVPLHWAAIKGHHECVQMLAAAGADPHVADPNGMVPLHWAACDGHHECVQMLVAAGADPYVVCNKGFTPLHCVARDDHHECVETLVVRMLSGRALRDDEWALVPLGTAGLGSMLPVVLARDGRDAAAKLVSLLPAADREVLETVAMSLGCKLPCDLLGLILVQCV